MVWTTNSSSTEEYNKFDSKVPAPSELSRAPTITSRPPPPPSSSQANEKASEPENVHGEQVVDEQDEQVRAPKRMGGSCGGLVFSKPGSPRVPPHLLTPTPPPPSQAKWVDDRATSPEVIEVEEEEGEEEAGASPGGNAAEKQSGDAATTASRMACLRARAIRKVGRVKMYQSMKVPLIEGLWS